MLEDLGFQKGGNSVVLGGAIIAGFFAAACRRAPLRLRRRGGLRAVFGSAPPHANPAPPRPLLVRSLPFDYVKTQMQKMKPDPVTGQMPYSSSMDCAMKTLKSHGPLRFYAGFPT